MSTLFTTEPGAVGAPRALPRTGPILVATDGRPVSGSAVGAAFLLAGQLAADVEVLAAMEPLPRYGPLTPAPDLEHAMQERLMKSVRKQISRSVARESGWPVHLLHGETAEVIARYAEEHDGRLVLLGRGPRDIRHRVLGGTLAMRLAQLTSIPILTVASPFHALPKRALVALDFSPRSLEAARAALALMPEMSTLYLAHVVPRLDSALGIPEEWEGRYAAGLEDAFAEAQHAIQAPARATVETLTLHGDPARELLTAAAQLDVDLIVCGTHGAGFVRRMLLGSVATRLLRAATSSVLVVPNAEPEEQMQHTTDRRVDQHAWAETLRRFSEHNAGRRAILEIDDPEIGAQAQVVDYPFLGAAFDPHTRQVELMFGGARARQSHLTHTIGDVQSVDVVEGGDGRDRVLRVAHATGQALVTLTT